MAVAVGSRWMAAGQSAGEATTAAPDSAAAELARPGAEAAVAGGLPGCSALAARLLLMVMQRVAPSACQLLSRHGCHVRLSHAASTPPHSVLQGVPTEREVLTTGQGLPVYRIMLRRL